jgi:hypothetical protein
MKEIVAQTLRMVGLLIEVAGLAVAFIWRAEDKRVALSLPGGANLPLAWLIVGLGFAIWLTGRLMLASSRSARRVQDDSDRDAAI